MCGGKTTLGFPCLNRAVITIIQRHGEFEKIAKFLQNLQVRLVGTK